jgi:hypothetical protein
MADPSSPPAKHPTDPLCRLEQSGRTVLRMVSTPRRWNFQQAQLSPVVLRQI